MKTPSWLDLRAILENPVVYNGFQAFLGASAARGRIIREYIPAIRGARVLEVGCGPGTNIEYIHEGMEYVGCDLSERYVRYAQTKYAGRGRFIHAAVGELHHLNLPPFDFVLASALLHHLDDAQVNTLCREVNQLMTSEGSFIAIESCFSPEQTALERWIITSDRGHYIRYTEDFEKLLRHEFSDVRSARFCGSPFNPRSSCVLRARKAAAPQP